MAKFSIGGDEEGAGSNSTPKRKRLCVTRFARSPINYYNHQPQNQEEEEKEVECDQEKKEEIPSSNLILTDPEVLDCPICFENLTIPVYQCENGHIACSLCSSTIRNKCPSCSIPIGYNRCRALERVLDTFRVKCENENYGCKVELSYASRKDHKRTCMYSSCSCPSPGCTVISSSNELYQHFSRKHTDDAMCFHYNCTFTVALHIEKIIILQEHEDNVLFNLYNEKKLIGNMVTLSCIWPSSFSGFCCDIVVKNEGTSLQFQSSIEGSPTLLDDPSPKRSVIIPSGFFNNDRPTLDICILLTQFPRGHPLKCWECSGSSRQHP